MLRNMFPFLKRVPKYHFPQIHLTSRHTKEAIQREISYLESRVDALTRLKKEKQYRNA